MKRRNFFASLFATALVPAVVKGMETETTVSGGKITTGCIKSVDPNTYFDLGDGSIECIKVGGFDMYCQALPWQNKIAKMYEHHLYKHKPSTGTLAYIDAHEITGLCVFNGKNWEKSKLVLNEMDMVYTANTREGSVGKIYSNSHVPDFFVFRNNGWVQMPFVDIVEGKYTIIT